MKRTTMLAAAAGAALVLGFGGTAVAAGLSDDSGRPTSGLGAAATPSADDSATPSAGPSSDDSAAPRPGRSTGDASPAASSSPASAPFTGAPVSREQAVAIARAHVGSGTVRDVESDDVHDRPAWKVEFDTDGGRRDVDVDKATGRVVTDELDDRNGNRGRDDDQGGRDDNGGRHSGKDDNRGGRHGGDDRDDD